MCCRDSVKGEGENRLEGTRRPILLITALIWWETLTDLDENNTQELPPLHFCLPQRMGGDRGMRRALFVINIIAQGDYCY